MPDVEMLTIWECAERTGLPYKLIRKMCLQGEIVCIRSGKKFYINYPMLCKYLSGEGKGV